jgi:hypothetical protein
MKKFLICLLVLVFIFSIIGCGESRVLGGVEYETYGLFNKEEHRSSKVKYRLIMGNIIWGVILCGTIVMPIYFFGFSMYEPVRMKNKAEINFDKENRS